LTYVTSVLVKEYWDATAAASNLPGESCAAGLPRQCPTSCAHALSDFATACKGHYHTIPGMTRTINEAVATCRRQAAAGQQQQQQQQQAGGAKGGGHWAIKRGIICLMHGQFSGILVMFSYL
jgi:hypothetical protein